MNGLIIVVHLLFRKQLQLHNLEPFLARLSPKNTIEVIGELRAAVSAQDKKIKILEANLNQAFKMIDALERRLKKVGL